MTMQLMELNMPMVLALNMMDELLENDGSVRVNEMEAFLGVPVVPISASKGEGIEELVKHAIHVAKYQECPMCCFYAGCPVWYNRGSAWDADNSGSGGALDFLLAVYSLRSGRSVG